MLSKFFVITVLITESDKTTSLTLSGFFRKSLLQCLTNRESFTNSKTIITKCDKKLSQSVTGITKCNKRLLQSVTSITKCDSYYKVAYNNSSYG